MTTEELFKYARRFEFPNGLLIDYRGKNTWAIVKNKGFGHSAVWSEGDMVLGTYAV